MGSGLWEVGFVQARGFGEVHAHRVRHSGMQRGRCLLVLASKATRLLDSQLCMQVGRLRLLDEGDVQFSGFPFITLGLTSRFQYGFYFPFNSR